MGTVTASDESKAKVSGEECYLRVHRPPSTGCAHKCFQRQRQRLYQHEGEAARPHFPLTAGGQKQGIPIPKANNIYSQCRDLCGKPNSNTQRASAWEHAMRFAWQGQVSEEDGYAPWEVARGGKVNDSDDDRSGIMFDMEL